MTTNESPHRCHLYMVRSRLKPNCGEVDKEDRGIKDMIFETDVGKYLLPLLAADGYRTQRRNAAGRW